jgi:hypothetical protein
VRQPECSTQSLEARRRTLLENGYVGAFRAQTNAYDGAEGGMTASWLLAAGSGRDPVPSTHLIHQKDYTRQRLSCPGRANRRRPPHRPFTAHDGGRAEGDYSRSRRSDWKYLHSYDKGKNGCSLGVGSLYAFTLGEVSELCRNLLIMLINFVLSGTGR